MTFLGVNKQLDLQAWLTQISKDFSLVYGWYEHRRPIQLGFFTTLALIAVFTQIWLYHALRDLGKEVRRAVQGLVILSVFVVTRAASFHHFDILIDTKIIGVRINWLLELGGIAYIAVATSAYLQRTSNRE
jgi:hypothetical protein